MFPADLGSLGTLEGHGAEAPRAPRISEVTSNLGLSASGLGFRSRAFFRFVGRVFALTAEALAAVVARAVGSRSGLGAWELGV